MKRVSLIKTKLKTKLSALFKNLSESAKCGIAKQTIRAPFCEALEQVCPYQAKNRSCMTLRSFFLGGLVFTTVCTQNHFIWNILDYNRNRCRQNHIEKINFGISPRVCVPQSALWKLWSPWYYWSFRLFQFIPTLFRDYHLSYFTSISSHFSAVLGVLFFILFSLSSLVLQNMLQLSQKNNSRWLAPCFTQDKSPAIKLSFCKL